MILIVYTYVCHIDCHNVYNNMLEAQGVVPAPLNSTTSRRAQTIIKTSPDSCLPLSRQTCIYMYAGREGDSRLTCACTCMPVERRKECPPHSTVDTIPIDIRDYVAYLCYRPYTRIGYSIYDYTDTSPHIIISIVC